MSGRDLRYIEALRTVAMVFVVLVHVKAYTAPGSELSWADTAFSVFVRYAVPAFFMISGFLLCRPESLAREFDQGAFLKKKVGSLVVPFYAWNVIYMALFTFLLGAPLNGETLWNVLTGYMHLYFVFVLLQMFLIFAFLRPSISKGVPGWFVAVAAVVTAAFFAVSEYMLWTGGTDGHFFEWHFGKLFAAWTMFFAFGMYLGSDPSRMDKLGGYALPLGIASLITMSLFAWETRLQAVVFGEVSRDYFLISGLAFQFLAGAFSIALGYRLDKSSKKGSVLDRTIDGLAKYGADTFGVYLNHVAVLIIVITAWFIAGLPMIPWIAFPAVFVLTALLSWGSLRVCRTRPLKWAGRILYGEK